MAQQPNTREASAAIGRHILRRLGQPADLQRIQVSHLWDTSYRVNVFVGVDFVSSKVVHSYFVVARENGSIVRCMPPLVQTYRLPREDGAGGETHEPH